MTAVPESAHGGPESARQALAEPAAGVGPHRAARSPLAALDKEMASACATALLQGVLATPGRNDRGERVIVLTWRHWTREIRPAELAGALAEARALQREAVSG